MSSALIKHAEAALDRGEYTKCIDLINKITQENKLNDYELSTTKMLIVTAFMGLGKQEEAISTCKGLINCKDPTIREHARQLILILEAPTLERPDNWSIKLPIGDLNSFKESKLNFKAAYTKGNNKKVRKTKALPPTGPTKGMDVGFVIIVMSFLILLTIFFIK